MNSPSSDGRRKKNKRVEVVDTSDEEREERKVELGFLK